MENETPQTTAPKPHPAAQFKTEAFDKFIKTLAEGDKGKVTVTATSLGDIEGIPVQCQVTFTSDPARFIESD